MYCKLIREAKESSLFINPAFFHNCFKLSKSLIFEKLLYNISSDIFKIILKIVRNCLKLKKIIKLKLYLENNLEGLSHVMLKLIVFLFFFSILPLWEGGGTH